jgi:hypothetical protein
MADSAIVIGAGTSPGGGEFVLKSSVTVECTDRGRLFLRSLGVVKLIVSISLPISRAAAAFNALSSSSDSRA